MITEGSCGESAEILFTMVGFPEDVWEVYLGKSGVVGAARPGAILVAALDYRIIYTEAALAGEAGAGFAVVAEEVRNLAMRAADAAKNTSNLIENTIKAVRNGNDLTKLTQEAFKENMDISVKIAQPVNEIATASQEQAHGISQINTAAAEMDKVTQQVAANSEESASASEEWLPR